MFYIEWKTVLMVYTTQQFGLFQWLWHKNNFGKIWDGKKNAVGKRSKASLTGVRLY